MDVNIKLFLVDGDESFRTRLKRLIESEPGMAVVGEAGDGETALERLRTTRSDLVVMAIRMPGIDGVETGKRLLERDPQAKIIFFTGYDNPDYVAKALELGAAGYILKDAGNKSLLTAIRTAYQGRFYFSGEVSDVLVRKYLGLQKERGSRSATTGEVALSKREEQILRLISGNLSNKEIAESLRVSVRTIEAHRLNILRKFQAGNIEEVLARLDTNG
jgi:DNA-binding NarL/FixJ family response regulator